MRVELDIGFLSFVVIVACVVVPVIGLILRSKWRRSAARKEEVRRLMILASEEAARAELETSASYGGDYAYGYDYNKSHAFTEGYRDEYEAAQGALARGNFCAVCYAPTTARCAKCKAVRYCSTKCQITHWRLGHKDECRPPVTKSEPDENPPKHKHGLSHSGKLEGKKSEKRLQSKSDNLLHGDLPTSDSSEAPKMENDDINAESSSGFSGFSTSCTSNESSDDVSICESNSSNDYLKLDELSSIDLADEKSGTNSIEKDVGQAEKMSPKFASLVDSVGRSAAISVSAESNTGLTQNDSSIPSKSANGSMQDCSDFEPTATSSSGFWEAALHAEPTGSLHQPSASPTRDGIESHDTSDCNASNSSGSNIGIKASLHVAPEEKDNSEMILEKVDRCNATNSLPLKIRHVRSSSNLTSVSSKPSEAKPSVSSSANASLSSLNDAPTFILVNTSTTADWKRNGRRLDLDSRSRQADGAAAAPAVSSENPSMSANAGRFGDIAGRYTNKGLFPYELFVKLYTWKEVELFPCGLMNCGNSCYANVVLQCLAFTPPLTAYFLQGFHSKMCAKKDWCFMCEFESLILKAKEGQSPVSPFRIVSHLEDIGSQLSNGREEDAHEFLRYVIDAMERVCLMESRISSSSSEEDTTLVGLTFGGYLRSKIRCTKCLGKSERQERMMDLTVEIDGNIGTLEEALKRYTTSETLDGENKYQCSRCGSYEKAKKKLMILEAPNVLTIALKRFQAGKSGKLDKSIRYPEILDLAPYVSGTSDKLPVYRLYGVIVHLDVMNASYTGHYVCYVKNPQNKWFKIDDSTVTPVDLETVLKVGAYMLLYSRCSPRAPRSIRNQIISSDLKPKPIPSPISSKIPTLSPKPSGGSSCDNLRLNKVSSDGLASIESFYSRFQRLSKMLEEDFPSDSSSLFSNNSDEGSSSSDGTQESGGLTEDFSEYLFGGYSSSLRNSSDSDSSSSSMPSSSSSSPTASSSHGRAPGFPQTTMPRVDSKTKYFFLHADKSKSSRNLLGSRRNSISSSGSNFRETNLDRLVDSPADGFGAVKSGRRSAVAGERVEKVL